MCFYNSRIIDHVNEVYCVNSSHVVTFTVYDLIKDIIDNIEAFFKKLLFILIPTNTIYFEDMISDSL